MSSYLDSTGNFASILCLRYFFFQFCDRYKFKLKIAGKSRFRQKISRHFHELLLFRKFDAFKQQNYSILLTEEGKVKNAQNHRQIDV